MTVGSLFAGIGGFDLGFERAGFAIKWQVELDPFATAVLARHFPEAKRYGDVRTVHGVLAHAAEFRCNGNSTLSGSTCQGNEKRRLCEPTGSGRTGCASCLEPVDVICGGFPCQPHSFAGRRAGAKDERDLWPEFARLIREARPRWVVAENVPGILSSDAGRFFGTILRDLAACGYDAEWDCISAADMGAPHLRERIWIVAYPNGGGLSGSCIRSEQSRRAEVIGTSEDVAFSYESGRRAREFDVSGQSQSDAAWSGEALADPARDGWESRRTSDAAEGEGRRESDRSDQQSALADPAGERLQDGPRLFRRGARPFTAIASCADWAIEPDVGRVAHGVPARVDRLKCLGNAIVPQVAEWIFRQIQKAEVA